MVDWQQYLTSVCKAYGRWEKVYTITDVVGERAEAGQEEAPPLLDLGLMVTTAVQDEAADAADDGEDDGEDGFSSGDRDKAKGQLEEGKQPKTEKLGVLEGLRKYAAEHLLLVGRPGSGKSTALVRLLLEEAQRCLKGEAALAKIPVLVELRSFESSAIELIRSFLKRHGVLLPVEEIERLLFEGEFLLLVDGVNELSSEAARIKVKALRQDHPKTPMIFTTRDIGLGGDLAISRKLEMQRLSERQMQQFVCKYLPLGQGEQMWRQMGEQLRRLGETPLLLWMLCAVFKEKQGVLPTNLGLVFRAFTKQYDDQIKRDVAVGSKSKPMWPELLKCLAFEMIRGNSPTEIWITVSQARAQQILTEYLVQEGVTKAKQVARESLEELLKHHLIQKRADDQIEFRHQLIQEYYAAEKLQGHLAELLTNKAALKREYLNYLKWTEPLKLLLELVSGQNSLQALALVKAALEVDLQLGAKLAGTVVEALQSQTVRLINAIELLTLPKIHLLSLTSSNEAIPKLVETLEDEDSDVRLRAVEALDKLGSDAAVPALITALEDKDSAVRWRAVAALGNLGSDATLPALLTAIAHEDAFVRRNAVAALGKLGSDAALPSLITALEHEDASVRRNAVEALDKLGSDAAVPSLIIALEDKDADVRWRAVEALGNLGSDAAVPSLITAIEHEDAYVRLRAVEALGNLGSDAAVPRLITAIEDKDAFVRCRAVEALGNLGSDAAVPRLITAIEHEDAFLRWRAVAALGNLGSDAAVPALIKALEHEDAFVRWRAIEALVKLGSDVALPTLIKAIKDEDADVRRNAVEALGKLGSDTVLPALIKAIEDENADVRRNAVEALGKLGSDAALPALIKATEDEDAAVRWRAVEALGKLASNAALSTLIKAIEDEDADVRWRAVEALGKLGSDAAIPSLITAIGDENSDVRWRAVEALGKLGSDAAVPALIKAIEDENSDVRWRAVKALGKLGGDIAVPNLIKAIEDEDAAVRWRAVEALGKLGGDAAVPALMIAIEHEDAFVRRSAVEALGNLGSDAALSRLPKAVEHEDAFVRRSAVEALGNLGDVQAISLLIRVLQYRGWDSRQDAARSLGKIASTAKLTALDQALTIIALVAALKDKYLAVRRAAKEALILWGNPRALKRLEQFQTESVHIECLEAMAGIQERCKFYSYELTQPLIFKNPETKAASKKTNSIEVSPNMATLNILHLSDLHFGDAEVATLWANQLAADLSHELDLPTLDTLILSGDIANYATPEEYTSAQAFLKSIQQDFKLSNDQIIIVPGNHDINWYVTDPEKNEDAAYQLKRRGRCTPEELREGYFIEEGEKSVSVREENLYKQRFANFSHFYNTIKGTPYPLDYAQQFTLHHLPQQNLLILGLNSAWNLDHHFTTRVSIHMQALTNALTQIRRNLDKYKSCHKIAVWHHPLDSPYTDRITDQNFLEQLAVAGFRLFLHGHVHEAETNQFRYDMSNSGRKLDRICAGTFGAPTRELTTAIPWQYNLLQLQGDTLTVRTRKRESENGAWKPDTRWLQGAGQPALDYYTITL